MSLHARPGAIELAKVPLTDRGIGWQADATATLKEQAAEIDALRKDAERYRWLRDQHTYDGHNDAKRWYVRAGRDLVPCDPGALDECIDAEMKEHP